MFGAEEFIKQRIPQGVIYSEIIWQASVTGVGVTDPAIVNVDYNKMGAKWILVHGLQISSDNSGIPGTLVNFIDAYNITLFTIYELREATGIFEFWFLMKGSKLFLQADSHDIKFSVGHQYLSLKEKEK